MPHGYPYGESPMQPGQFRKRSSGVKQQRVHLVFQRLIRTEKTLPTSLGNPGRSGVFPLHTTLVTLSVAVWRVVDVRAHHTNRLPAGSALTLLTSSRPLVERRRYRRLQRFSTTGNSLPR